MTKIFIPANLIRALVQEWLDAHMPEGYITRGGWVHLPDTRKYTVHEAYSLISNSGVL